MKKPNIGSIGKKCFLCLRKAPSNLHEIYGTLNNKKYICTHGKKGCFSNTAKQKKEQCFINREL